MTGFGFAALRRDARDVVLPGALAGLIGGLPFGAAMIELGVLPSVASLVRADSPVVGFIVHMTIAAIVGAGLGILLRGRWSAGDVVFWGVAYGAFFWFLGPITLGPLILGGMPAWDVAAARAAFPSLLGHVIWGATAGLAIVALNARSTGGLVAMADQGAAPEEASEAIRGTTRVSGVAIRGIGLRGVAAGLLAYGAIGLLPGAAGRMISPLGEAGAAAPWAMLIAVGGAIVYAVLHPRSSTTAGAALVRGAAYGVVLWVVGGLTLLPLLGGDGLAWAPAAAREAFPALPGTILLGAATALIYHWLSRLARLFFSDRLDDPSPDGGSWGLRAVGRGAAAGLVGGLLFTLVMVQIGFLPTVARLVGSDSELVGLIVHLVIAEIVGVSFGVLFRRQAFDPTAAIGWGVSYGFVWWVLGPLTLAPVILGLTPAWTVDAAGAAFPGLIGHLAYGAGLGLTFHALEARYSPWWITRTETEVARMAGRRAEATSAGPAVWALLVMLSILLPIVLAP
ncbi:MAG: hypothetical protein L0221_06050 [Chloroflexi bacterium]|nr:hypothetical protein [Chloroflexota bacterium]